VQGNGSEANGQPLGGATVYIDANHDGHLDPGDPTAVTDASGAYVFPKLTPGTYTVAIDPNSIAQGNPVAAIDIPAGAVGHNPYTGTVGLDFNVNQPITITQLGVFDSGQTGLKQPLTAYLYNRVTQQLLAKLVFTPDDPGTLIGGTLFKPLDQPITLPAGFEGTIAADGFGPNQMFESYQPDHPGSGPQPGWSVNDLGGRISFVNGRSGPTPGQFPPGLNAGEPVPYPYEAVSFLVDHPAWFQTSVPAGGTYTVTISSGGYDLHDLNDFSVAPYTPITGKISGAYLDPSGHLQGLTTPLVGWVVQLLNANQQVVATTTTDAAGRYYFDKIPPGQYTVHQVLPAGWRQADPLNTDLQFGTPTDVGTGSEQASAGVVSGDFNNDGRLDFAAPSSDGSLVFYIYDPSSDSYTQTVYQLKGPVEMIAVGNFGGHGRADLAILENVGPTVGIWILFLNDGKAGQLSFTEVDLPQLTPDGGVPVDVKAGDFNNDGMDDLVISYQSGPNAGGVAVILDPADPSKRTITPYPLADFSGQSNAAGGLAIRDLNGDGNLDVVLNAGPLLSGNLTPTFAVALGDGKGNLGAWKYYLNSQGEIGGNRTVSLGDVRQNGSQDALLFTANPGADTYSIDLFLNQGGGVYNQAQHLLDETLYKRSTLPVAAALVDMNGDLKPDLVLLFPGTGAQGDGGAIVVFLNTGVAPYFDISKPLVFSIPGGSGNYTAQFMAIADLNNDSLNDLLAFRVGGPGTIITRLLNATPQNPPTQAVTLTYGQTISNGNDFVNAQLPHKSGLGKAPSPSPSPSPAADDATLYVRDLYRQILRRDADPDELAHWVALLKAGTTHATIVQAIWDSPEHRGLEVDQLYGHDLDRVAAPQGSTSWANALLNGMSETEATRGFLTREEYRQAPADVPGDQAWVAALFEHRLTKEQITQAFLASDKNFSPAGATGGTARP
jgi:hypothetical protein